MSDLIGQTIHGYQLHELIGVGGVGAVYRAHQLSVGREVVIKVVLSQYANKLQHERQLAEEQARQQRERETPPTPRYRM